MEKLRGSEALAEAFQRHAEEEGRVLEEYRALAAACGDGPLSRLLELILADEEVHHLQLLTMAKWLREGPGVGTRTEVALAGVDRERLLARTRTLKRHEEETAESCQAMQADLTGEQAEPFRAILEAMAQDSRKHHHLLSVVERLLASATRK